MPNSAAPLLNELYINLSFFWHGMLPFVVALVLCLFFYLVLDPIGKKKNWIWLITALMGFFSTFLVVYLWLLADEGVLLVVSQPHIDYAGHDRFSFSFAALAAVYGIVSFFVLSFPVRTFSVNNVWTPPIGMKK